MEKTKGFLKVDRDLFTTELWRDNSEPFCKRAAYIDLLRRVNYGDVVKKVDDKVVTIHAGEAFVALSVLSEDWGWTRSKVNRFLKKLERAGYIKTEIREYGTIITVTQSESGRNSDRNSDRNSERNTNRNSNRNSERNSLARVAVGLPGNRETATETASETVTGTGSETVSETVTETTIRRSNKNSTREETEDYSKKPPKPPLRVYPPGMENFSSTTVAPFGWGDDGHPLAPYGLRPNGIPVVPDGYKFKRQ